jgi:hypothetical protein
MFASLIELAEQPDAVATYRHNYLMETGFSPGRCIQPRIQLMPQALMAIPVDESP